MQITVTRRSFLLTSTAAVAAGSLGLSSRRAAAQQGGARKPNLLLILTDQQTLDTMHGLGMPESRHLHTPHMDRRMARGTTFTRSYSANPVCSPARSCLFTGRMPSETGVITNRLPIGVPDMPLLSDLLQAQGYQTWYCGKWHVPDVLPKDDFAGFRFLPTGSSSGFDGVSQDMLMAAAAEGFFANYPRNREPFFLALNLMSPHGINDIDERIKTQGAAGVDRKVTPDMAPPPVNFGAFEALPEREQNGVRDWSPEAWAVYRWTYDRMVENLDVAVGRILDALDASGLADQTLVVFTSDHGECRGSHQLVRKNSLFEESATVPLIVSWPGHIAAGAIDREHVVSNVDIVPTLLDYAGGAAPGSWAGRSLRPLLEQKPANWREFVVVENNIIGRAVCTGDYKLIAYHDDPAEFFFDLRSDPHEQRNLIADASAADAVRDHRKMLVDWESRLDLPRGSRFVWKPYGAFR